MNHLEFLEDTISFYSADPVGRRAVNGDGHCKYRIFNDNGEKIACCAIGRHIPDEKYVPNLEKTLLQVIIDNNILSDEIKTLKEEFLLAVQQFHDDRKALDGEESYWCGSGLTENGLKRANQLREVAKILDAKAENS